MGKNLLEEELTIESLFKMGNAFEQLAALINIEMFHSTLEMCWSRSTVRLRKYVLRMMLLLCSRFLYIKAKNYGKMCFF